METGEITVQARTASRLKSVLYRIGFSVPNDTTLGAKGPDEATSVDIS